MNSYKPICIVFSGGGGVMVKLVSSYSKRLFYLIFLYNDKFVSVHHYIRLYTKQHYIGINNVKLEIKNLATFL